MIIKINELFNSISGEYSPFGQGCTTTFLRLSGCNLKCFYCDTDHSGFTEHDMGVFVPELLQMYSCTDNLCITGGEPLLQLTAVEEITKFIPNVWIETNGTVDFNSLIGKTPLVVDYKIDYYKGEIPQRFHYLTEKDCIKFVIFSKSDFNLALEVHKMLKRIIPETKFAYSPVHDAQKKTNLVSHVIGTLEKEHLTGIINLQIHKYFNLK